jgi:hypothetical protein
MSSRRQFPLRQIGIDASSDVEQHDTAGRIAFAGRGTISFSRIHNYIHPSVRKSGIAVPQKPSAFQKTLNKHVDTQIMGNHGHYLNDVFHKIYRLSDAFQFMSVKYTFETLLDVVWFETTVPCFHIKDDNIYVLGKVQCKNNNNQKWFGDTFILTDDDKIVKCVWYKDFDLKRFFVALKPLLKDILNLYLVLVNWVLKHKKIKLKLPKQDLKSFDANDLSRLITETIHEYKYDNLVDNIQKLNSYETFYPIFKSLIERKTKDVMLYSNMKHVFKDELLPCSWGESLAWPRGPKISIINEEFSLMNMNDSELTGNYYYLMYYILPDSEKNIFISKE